MDYSPISLDESTIHLASTHLTRCRTDSSIPLARRVYTDAQSFADLFPSQKFALTSVAKGIERGRLLCSYSAAVVLDLPIPSTIPTHCWASNGHHQGSHWLTHRLPSDRESMATQLKTNLGTVLSTSIPHTIADISRLHSMEDALCVADAALFGHRCTSHELELTLQQSAGLNGVHRMRIVTALASPGSESPGESRMKYQLWTNNFPAPILQAVICDQHGTFIGKVDLFYPDYGVVLEYDGRDKYTPRYGHQPEETIVSERLREKLLTNSGLLVLRVTAENLATGVWLGELAETIGHRAAAPNLGIARTYQWSKGYTVSFPRF